MPIIRIDTNLYINTDNQQQGPISVVGRTVRASVRKEKRKSLKGLREHTFNNRKRTLGRSFIMIPSISNVKRSVGYYITEKGKKVKKHTEITILQKTSKKVFCN